MEKTEIGECRVYRDGHQFLLTRAGSPGKYCACGVSVVVTVQGQRPTVH